MVKLNILGMPILYFEKTPRPPKPQKPPKLKDGSTINNYANCVFQDVYPAEMNISEPQNTENSKVVRKQLTVEERKGLIDFVSKESGLDKGMVEYILNLNYEYLTTKL